MVNPETKLLGTGGGGWWTDREGSCNRKQLSSLFEWFMSSLWLKVLALRGIRAGSWPASFHTLVVYGLELHKELTWAGEILYFLAPRRGNMIQADFPQTWQNHGLNTTVTRSQLLEKVKVPAVPRLNISVSNRQSAQVSFWHWCSAQNKSLIFKGDGFWAVLGLHSVQGPSDAIHVSSCCDSFRTTETK